MERPVLLCRLDLCHDYFADGVCRALLPRPSPQGAARLRALGWHARCARGRLELWAPAGAELPDEPLLFWLENDDPFLANYTAGVGGAAGLGVWYFDDSADGDTLNLRDGASLPVRLAVGVHRQQLALDAAARPAGWALVAAGRAVRSGPVPPAGPLALDLDGLPEGRYALVLDGAGARDLVLCGDPPPSVWGVVALHRFAPALRLALRSRATRWRYRVTAVGDDVAQLKRCTVTGACGENELAFSGPEITDGTPGTAVFTSQSALPLCERAAGVDLRLRIPSATAGWTRELRLQHAQGRSLAVPARDGSGDYFSDIHVHL